MSAPAAATAPGGRPPRQGGDALRRFLAIDERQSFVRGAQTLAGRALIFALASAAAASYFAPWQAALMVAAAMAAAYRPASRNAILFAATWALAWVEIATGGNDTLDNIGIVLRQEGEVGLSPLALATAFLLLFLGGARASLIWVRRHPQSLLARRPLLTLLALEAVICGLTTLDAVHGTPRVLLWTLLVVLTPYLWFLPYAIVDQRSRDASPPLLQLAVQRPFWSPTYLPFGKGAAFLRKTLAKTPEDLAVTQLKALKLLLWSNALLALKAGLSRLFGEGMGIPEVGEAVAAFLAGRPYPLALGWSALVLSTARYALQVACWAHLFIGIARLAGYRLPRGSWRPLESRTLMDYFNRFHYYFKELLVDFFFMPTFFAVFRKHPRLRMFFATFMAAGVGNALWHFVRDIGLVAGMGLAAALESFASYAFYCLVLATGVGLSQVRANLGIRPPDTRWGRIHSFFFVWSFVVCMHVFSDGSRNHSLGERMSFLASLFGVG